MSLARGLDYYTGIIYEAVTEASAPPGFNSANAFAASASVESTPQPPRKEKKAKPEGEEDEVDESQVGVGSIAAGGRYDNLVGMFTAAASGEGKKATQLPCVGVSIGMDRVFALVWPKWVERGMRAKEVMAFVMSAGDGLLEERIALVTELRNAGIKVKDPALLSVVQSQNTDACFHKADFSHKNKPKLPAQFAAGERDEVPFAIILGGDELKEGLVTVKEQRWELVDGKKTKVESANKGAKVRRDELVQWLKDTATYRAFQEGKWD
jgi:histidyl-tRNA synthetase